MAYTIVKSDGTILTTIADGTINTTSTSLGLPGRNFAGYGQALDTNFTHQLENFADSTPPPNPIRGQLWYNTNANTMCVCPSDGETNAANWIVLTSTSSGGTTTFGSVTVTGDLQANTVTAINSVTAADGIFTNISVSSTATMGNVNATVATIGTLTSTSITAGSNTTAGTLTGAWTVAGSGSGNGLVVSDGNIYATVGIKVNPSNFYDLSGNIISIDYGNSNVANYLPTFTGTVGTGAAIFRGASLSVTGNANVGNLGVTGVFATTLSATGNANVGNLAAGNITSPGNITSNSNVIVNADGGSSEGVFINTLAGAPVGKLVNNSDSAFALSADVSTLQLYANNSLMASFVDVGVNRLANIDANLTVTGNITANIIQTTSNPKFLLVPDVDYSVTGTGFFRLDTAIYNVGNGTFNSGTESFRVPVSGYYQLNVGYRALIDATNSVTFTLSSTNTITSLTTTWTTSRTQFVVGAGNTTGYFGTIAFLTPTDQLAVTVTVGGGANLAISNSSRSSFFSGFLIP